MRKKILISPSILSADFSRLGEEVKAVQEAGADLIHVDVMDGHFVPNLTIGPVVVQSIHDKVQIPLDVHLMIEEPEKYIDAFAKAGSNIITFHIEAVDDAVRVISLIKKHGLKAGVSIKPDTKVESIRAIAGDIDLVLVMTVEPGFGGQSFMDQMLGKIKELKSFFDGDISVDGGINVETAKQAVAAGANILVAGTAIFGKDDYAGAIKLIRGND